MARLGTDVPAGATVNRATLHRHHDRLDVAASPASANMKFRIAGMVNPAVVVPAGSHVSMHVINADNDTAHGLVVAAGITRPGGTR